MDLTPTLTCLDIATTRVVIDGILKYIDDAQHPNCRLSDRFPKINQIVDSVIVDIKKTLKSKEFKKKTHFKQQPIDLMFLTDPLNENYVKSALEELEVLNDPFTLMSWHDYRIRNKVILLVRHFNGLNYTLLPIFAWNVKERQPEQLIRFSI